MLETMTNITDNFNTELIKSVKNGNKFRIVGDNVNFHLGVAQARKSLGKTGHMEHWFGSAAIVQNVCFAHLSNIQPQYNLLHLPTERLLMQAEEFNQVTSDFSILVSQVLVDFFPWLKFAKSAVDIRSEEILPELKRKNIVIPLPILHKNEQNYSEVIDILDMYQDLCEKTFEAAQQPLQKVHVGGDQLTRERFTGAKRLRAAAYTASDRLETLAPITFELFHLQMTVLNTFYQVLYDTHHTDSFTLYSQKINLMRKDADGNDVKNHYDSCRELAVSVIRAYIVEAACEHFQLPNINTIPENIPDHHNMSSEEIRNWLVGQVNPIVDNICSVSREVIIGNCVENVNTDPINCYGNILVELGLVFMLLCDIIKNPSRERMLYLMKYLMLILKGHNNKSKYALELLRFLCQQLALLSEQAANEVFYGLFVNTGKTIIPADLQMEQLVKLTKSHLRSMCSNVSDTSLIKRSSAFFGMNKISNLFHKEIFSIKRSQKHKRLSSVEDEKKIIQDLRLVRPFFNKPGRLTDSLKKKPVNPITKLDTGHLIKWVETNKVKFFFEL